MQRQLRLILAATVIAASTPAIADCAPLGEIERLVIQGFGGTPFQELTAAQIIVARAVLLNPGNPADIAALGATRVLVSKTKFGDEATIFVVDDQACSFGFMPAGTISVIDALKDRPINVGEGI